MGELTAWRDQVRERALTIAGEMLSSVAPAAVRGRKVKLSLARTELLTAAIAEIWFSAALRKALAPATGTTDAPDIHEEIPA